MKTNDVTRKERIRPARRRPLWPVVAAAVLLLGAAQAAPGAVITLGIYTFTGGTSPSSVPTVLTLDNFIAGSGATEAVSGGKLAVDNINQSSLAAAVTAGDYVSFTVTPQAGYRYTVSAIKYDVSLTRVSNVTLESSIGGFGSGTAVTANTSSTTGYTYTLGSSYANLTGATEFRFYSWNGGGGTDFTLDNLSITGDTQARASLSTSLGTAPAARVMQNTANVRYSLGVTNDALSGGSLAAEGLNYSLATSGAAGLSLSSTSGTGLAGGTSATHYLTVDTSTTGLKGGGTVTVTGANAWRANGTAGASAASYDLSTVAVLAQRSVTADTVVLGGRYLSGALLENLGPQSLTLRSSGADTAFTRVTVAGHLFAGPDSFTTHASGSGPIAASGSFASYAVTGEGLAGEGTYANVPVSYTAAVVGNAQADQSGSPTRFADPLSAVLLPGGSLAGLESRAWQAVNGSGGAALVGGSARLLGGVYAGSSAGTVSMAWRTRTPDEAGPAHQLISDVVDLRTDATAEHPLVVQMSYDPSLLAPSARLTEDFLARNGYLFLSWLDATGRWGNVSGSGSSGVQAGWAAAGSPTTPGAWGVDTKAHVVWAVADRDGQFSVLPEPATIGMLVIGGLLALLRRQGRRCRA